MEENMKTKHNLFVLFILVGGLILSAWGSEATTKAYQVGAAATQAPAMAESFAAQAPVAGDAAKENVSSAPAAAPVYDLGLSPDDAAFAASHMIVKNADIKLLVEDTDLAIDRSTQAVGDLGGYILSSTAWGHQRVEGEKYKDATITTRVAVDNVEHTPTPL